MIVSETVRELLATRIDSFEKLDLIILLHDASHGVLAIDELVARLGLGRAEVRGVIGELRRAMLVDLTSGGEVQLMLPTEGDRTAVAELVAVYRADRALVVRVLGELAMKRIRGMAATAFSDAFVLGKGKRGGGDG